MARAPITEQPIHVYTCLDDPSRKPLAVIEGFPMLFYADTPMLAKRSADEWRRKAVADDKLIPKSRKAELLGEGA